MPYHPHPHIIICTSFISSIDYNVFIVLQCHLKDHFVTWSNDLLLLNAKTQLVKFVAIKYVLKRVLFEKKQEHMAKKRDVNILHTTSRDCYAAGSAIIACDLKRNSPLAHHKYSIDQFNTSFNCKCEYFILYGCYIRTLKQILECKFKSRVAALFTVCSNTS